MGNGGGCRGEINGCRGPFGRTIRSGFVRAAGGLKTVGETATTARDSCNRTPQANSRLAHGLTSAYCRAATWPSIAHARVQAQCDPSYCAAWLPPLTTFNLHYTRNGALTSTNGYIDCAPLIADLFLFRL